VGLLPLLEDFSAEVIVNISSDVCTVSVARFKMCALNWLHNIGKRSTRVGGMS